MSSLGKRGRTKSTLSNISPAAHRLESWKEIAAYLLRDKRTVQRWEKLLGLPVRRLRHDKASTVYAFPLDLDAWYRERQPAEEERAKPARVRLVVLPFANLGGASEPDYFSAALTDELITQLGRLDPQRLGVIAATSSKLLAGKPIDELGRVLDVQYVLEGSVCRAGHQVRINVQLVLASDQTHLWADSYTDDVSDILRVQNEVAADVASRIHGALPVPARKQTLPLASPARTVNPEAYDSYLKGRFYWSNRADLRKSLEAFQQALEKDPRYALAHAGLASTYVLLGQAPYDELPPLEAKPRAREAAQRALQLDPRLAEAHAVLANVAYSYDWNFKAAEREFRRAFALDPHDPTAHLWYARYSIMSNRLPQAQQEITHALDLDPVSPLFNSVRAEIFYTARQYDAAIAQAQRTLEQFPSFPLAHFWLGSAYREKGMIAEALEEISKARRLSPGNHAMFGMHGHMLAVAGDVAGARKALGDLKELAKTRYVPTLSFAAIYTGLRENTEALDWLDKACEEHNDRLIYLGVDPVADPLRSEPRFRDLLRRIGL